MPVGYSAKTMTEKIHLLSEEKPSAAVHDDTFNVFVAWERRDGRGNFFTRTYTHIRIFYALYNIDEAIRTYDDRLSRTVGGVVKIVLEFEPFLKLIIVDLHRTIETI